MQASGYYTGYPPPPFASTQIGRQALCSLYLNPALAKSGPHVDNTIDDNTCIMHKYNVHDTNEYLPDLAPDSTSSVL